MTTAIRNSLKTLALLQLLTGTALSLAVALIWDAQLGASFAIGCALMVLIVTFLVTTTWLTVAKKSIAWSVLVIVIKYPVLLGSIVFLTQTNWFRPVAAGLGVCSFLIAVLALAVLQEKETQIGSSSF